MRGVVTLATLAALAVAATLGACASKGGAGGAGGQAPPTRTTLRVQNQNFLDMNIYVVRPFRVRLGLAPGVTTTTFVIPSAAVGNGSPMRFLADPIGGRATPVSEEIFVQAGEEVTLIIPPG